MGSATMTRRSFAKLAAMGAAATALGVSSEAHLVEADESRGEDVVVKQATNCAGCISNCSVIATIKNGRVIRLEGDPNDILSRGRVCPKGLAGISALYHPNRTKYPMKRVGERGVDNTWERITWDEGITMVAEALIEMRDKTGRNGLFCTTGGGGNPNFFAPQQFRNMWGAGNVCEPGCAQCYLPREWAEPLVNGMGNTSMADGNGTEMFRPNVGECTDMAVFWGTGPAQHSPSNCGRCAVEMREAGVKTVVIDPRFTPDAARADVWLPIRPGTDVALMLAWASYIIENEKYNKEYVTRWSNLPFLVDPDDPAGALLRASRVFADVTAENEGYVYFDEKTGEVTKAFALSPENEADYNPLIFGDGIEVALADGSTITCKTAGQAYREAVSEWTLEKAAEVCWLDVDAIQKALDIYTSARTGGISLGVATDQGRQSVQAAQAVAALDSLMGFIGKKGDMTLGRGGRMQSPYKTQQGKVSTYDGPGGMVPTYNMTEESIRERLGYQEYKGFASWQHSHIPTVLNAILTGEPYQPHVWIERSGNKMAMFGNAASWLPAIQKMDFICHSYMYPTSFTFEAADVIFPITEWLESVYSANRANLSCMRADTTLLFEHCDDRFTWYTIIEKLAELGDENAQKALDWGVGYTNKEWDLYLKSLTFEDMTWEETKALYPIKLAEEDEYWDAQTYESYNNVGEDGAYTGFSGCAANDIKDNPKKNGIYGDTFIYLGRHGNESFDLGPASEDYQPVPYYVEPGESPLTDTEYPLVMTEGRVMYYHHGTLRNNPYLRELYPAPEVWIDPDAAAERGIQSGDWVNVKSRRCEENEVVKDGIYGVAYVTPGVCHGAVYMERFWNPEFLEEGQDARKSWTLTNMNVLTKNDPPYNPEIGSYTLRGFQVEVTKAERPEGLWYEPKDFEPWLPQVTENTGGGYAIV